METEPKKKRKRESESNWNRLWVKVEWFPIDILVDPSVTVGCPCTKLTIEL